MVLNVHTYSTVKQGFCYEWIFFNRFIKYIQIGGTRRKHDEILKSHEGLSIDDSFKSGYLNQMSLRDFSFKQ